MRQHLPLNALRAFEAAARHTSFSRAAEELCVTPTAISHQIRTLEDILDVTLFERRSGRLVLTLSAAAALVDLSEGFDKLESAMRPLSRRTDTQKLTVSASSSVASLWLMPRLHRFTDAAPGIDVSIETVIDPVLFGDISFDVAICNAPEIAGRKVAFLMGEEILPVCASHLVSDRQDWRRIALTTLPLIHDDKLIEHYPKWQHYFALAGINGRDPKTGLRFNQSSLAVEAAIAGHGLLLGRSRLIGGAIEAGQLVSVAGSETSFRQDYYTVRSAGSPSQPARLFLDWLAAEVRRDDLRETTPLMARNFSLLNQPSRPVPACA